MSANEAYQRFWEVLIRQVQALTDQLVQETQRVKAGEPCDHAIRVKIGNRWQSTEHPGDFRVMSGMKCAVCGHVEEQFERVEHVAVSTEALSVDGEWLVLNSRRLIPLTERSRPSICVR